jgi:ankyrin repeat protein
MGYKGKRGQCDRLSAGDVLGYLHAAATAVHEFLSELPASDGDNRDDEEIHPVRNFIHLACLGLVYYHDFGHIVPWIQPGKATAAGAGTEESRITRSDLLPILALHGDIRSIRALLLTDEEVNINHCNKYFGSALYAAAALDHPEVIELLLSHGADVNQIGGRWYTPLQAAVAETSDVTQALSVLLAAGADVNLQGGDYNSTALIRAAQANNPDAVAILLSQKDVDVSLIDWKDESIIHHLCRAGDADNLRKLLAEHPGANLKQRGRQGTALHAATNFNYYEFTEGHDQVVEILLDRGVSAYDVAPDAEGNVVHWARVMNEEAGEDGEVLPAALERVLRWDAERRGPREHY